MATIIDLLYKLVHTLPIYVALALIPLALHTLYQAYATPLRHIPGPFFAKFTRLWILRAVASRRWDRKNIELHKKYGPVVRVAPNELSIDDPDAANIIYRSRDQLPKAPRYSAWGLPPPAEPNLFVTLDIDVAAKRRRQIASLYQPAALTDIEYQADRTMKTFFSKLDTFASSHTSFDLAKWLQFYAFDTIGTITFDRTFGFLDTGEDVKDISSIIHTYARYGAVVGNFPALHKPIFNLLQILAPAGETGLAYVMSFSSRSINEWNAKRSELEKKSNEEATAGGDTLKTDFMSSLLAKTRRDPTFTDPDVHFHILNNVAAGGETTGISLSACMYHLLRNPSTLAKLRKELTAAGIRPGQAVPFRQAQQCAYLQAVIKETLRIFPAAGLNLLRVVPPGGLTLASHYIPAGTDVGVNPYAAHANHEVFGADADDFRPERWIERGEKEVARMESYFLTFGKGPRNCLGKGASLLEMNKLVPELVVGYEWEFAFGRDGEEGAKGDWVVHDDWFVLQENLMVKVGKREG
ncbi:hypothetical protein MMC21_006552 [Puttea exsequens]|nr:hypothetical protein [Puttea exsequens]